MLTGIKKHSLHWGYNPSQYLVSLDLVVKAFHMMKKNTEVREKEMRGASVGTRSEQSVEGRGPDSNYVPSHGERKGKVACYYLGHTNITSVIAHSKLRTPRPSLKKDCTSFFPSSLVPHISAL